MGENTGKGGRAVPDINSAEGKDLFEALFAKTGSRETISLEDWKNGWASVVGGINGIPTSRQFNTLQYITDLKCLLLYHDVMSARSGGCGVKIGTAEELDSKNLILLERMKDSNKIVRVLESDSENEVHRYELASEFRIPDERERLQSGDSLPELFGKIARHLVDLKAYCFNGADNPFVLMTEATYRPPDLRAEGCLYGLVTKKRGLVIITFDRYVTGMEEPKVKNTLYGVERRERTEGEREETPYMGILNMLVHIEEGQEIERQMYMLYAVTKKSGQEDDI